SSMAEPKNPVEDIVPTPVSKRRPVAKSTRSLLEFPSVNRSAMPEWRKELGERVREVQERRAREAALETAEIGSLFTEVDAKTVPMLELLPQAEMPPINPVVVAALKRIERAQSQGGRNHSAATAIAYEQQPAEVPDLAADPVIDEITPEPERVCTLAVVPNPELISAEVPEEIMPTEPRKPIRVIDGHNDPALHYLDSVPRSVIVETREYRRASIFRRMLSALFDLAVIGVLALPLLALTELTNLQEQNLRVIGFAVVTLLVIGFLYLTISVAFTGRTIGMKLFSLRVVDARNGLIPTGRQSAGRSLLYLLSLAGAGITLLYTFINAEKQTVHDRFTRTVVIRA
ncbi:MAG TPA: RDD family protein, partial [Pyrinomonadaceae bacterium]|nr:RDD family protein [Pyrinomonadaceae bacterium]